MRENDGDRGLTRRAYLASGGAVVASGALAGCSTESGPASEGNGTDDTTSAAGESQTSESGGADGSETTDGARSETESSADGPYTVSMAPMGEVEFERVPTSIFTRLTHHAGMAFALGRGNDVNAMHAPDWYDAIWNLFTPRLPGVELDWSGLYSSWQVDKEHLYELDSDVHLADPASVDALENWDESDIDEIAENVGPWFGNSLSARHQDPPEAWADRYEYYTLWEQFETVAEVFQERERYEALASIRDDMVATIEGNLPPESERPTVTMAGTSDLESIYVYKVNVPGFLASHTRPFGLVDAFGDDVASGAAVDMEAMVAADPDAIIVMGGMHPERPMSATRQAIEDHPVGGDLSAVQNDRVYAQAARYQGPILNLFQTEMTAKQLFPEQFGEWPLYDTGPYPELSSEEQLFDHQRVADIINGEF
ncbi:ABC transporter substrate-binding protein [Halomarina salina]|uniref:ABC transporter substrate-binding protein n=1 Tax=Halomarina salina TaxID=1872699 RepID=A0ABD5RJ91_9EURY|nr:ABC transporter substrate-binding protein [Halomarina salina]